MGLRHATPDPSLLSEGERGARQATISFARLRRARISGFPSPHHATRPLASKEMPPHLVMQARKKHSVQHVVKAAFGARIGAIEGKCPLLPAKPDHGAPLLHHCVFFGHEHWNFLHSHDGHMTASINATCWLAAKASERSLGGDLSNKGFVTSDQPTLFAKPKSGLKTFQLMP